MENKWISVEDRLPEEEVNVLVFEDGNMEVAAYFGTDQAGQPCWASKYGMLHRVTQWQPLPEYP